MTSTTVKEQPLWIHDIPSAPVTATPDRLHLPMLRLPPATPFLIHLARTEHLAHGEHLAHLALAQVRQAVTRRGAVGIINEGDFVLKHDLLPGDYILVYRNFEDGRYVVVCLLLRKTTPLMNYIQVGTS
ncbi:hypothetical protein BUALT_Bualt12G0097400 [Buddleja alternifolia]|uniref:Uncharacterized protein n=1 Tax=Buddleja alternifolia TaxID=168488 RepID=A0AAV6WW84_9LAMI|nr:hypothetical protein BUALT_Bualt12G0097400 [Buddleja alternifolia]